LLDFVTTHSVANSLSCLRRSFFSSAAKMLSKIKRPSALQGFPHSRVGMRHEAGHVAALIADPAMFSSAPLD